MYPELSLRHQSGAGLPIALFIITVLALIVVGMAQLQEGSGQAVSLQIQSQRAFFAAESGAQVAVRDVLEAGSCSAVSSSVAFSASALHGCNASLTCESAAVNVSVPGGDTIFSIVSAGQCGAGADQATRMVEVRVR
ncbi:MSHA biogenesis protein MshP [Marinobacter daqiaonensis]|uniref:MSHA biogenesis protein MshP n=1 Tax=Marinobacter daqiaonensis TaxID=650891 RepID=A0A1I6K2N0_9GAMM|nr:hypothetical protein [Marinobacter daqiaonensis]SFR85070.1 MSHA biogenesis protein MshP [Marinobacter daqiaonensis]